MANLCRCCQRAYRRLPIVLGRAGYKSELWRLDCHCGHGPVLRLLCRLRSVLRRGHQSVDMRRAAAAVVLAVLYCGSDSGGADVDLVLGARIRTHIRRRAKLWACPLCSHMGTDVSHIYNNTFHMLCIQNFIYFSTFRYTTATRAVIIGAPEPVFAAIGAYLWCDGRAGLDMRALLMLFMTPLLQV